MPYADSVMAHEWAYGRDIGEIGVLRQDSATIGLDEEALIDTLKAETNRN